MMKKTRSEKGQALLLIALAIFGLIGLIALAIDGGNAFSDRRQAQNAADAAALAASMRYAQDQTLTFTQLSDLVVARTSTNGYTNTAPRSQVVLSATATSAGDCPKDAAGFFFQVDIDSTLPTWFGTVVGISQVQNHVTSKTLSCPPVYEPPYNGNALVALSKTACQALKISGSSQTIVTSSTNQGIFVNSNCRDVPTSPQNALYGGSGSVSAPSVSVVGGVYGESIFAPVTVQTGVKQVTKTYVWPAVDTICPTGMPTATIQTIGGQRTMNSGVFPGTNNSWAHKDFPPENDLVLNPGTYCLDNDFKAVGGDVLTGVGVTLVQRSGIVSIQGGKINLSAPSTNPYFGLLFYVPVSNTLGSVTINGNGDSNYFGSIVAPAANATLNGGGTTTGPFRTQVIADTITIGGNGTLNIYYDADTSYQPPLSAGIELIK